MRALLRLLAIAVSAASLAPAPAAAQASAAVVVARQSGAVGERFDGYLGFVAPPTPQLRKQVEATNIRRRALYYNLSARRGVTAVEVGISAGCQLLARVQVGEAYMLSDGAWRRRLPGQQLPIPDYCG